MSKKAILLSFGATTENPSFELNNALLSRARVYVLKSLTKAELQTLLHQTLTHERGLKQLEIDFSQHLQAMLIQAADGDARTLLNLLEMLSDFAENQKTCGDRIFIVRGLAIESQTF